MDDTAAIEGVAEALTQSNILHGGHYRKLTELYPSVAARDALAALRGIGWKSGTEIAEMMDGHRAQG